MPSIGEQKRRFRGAFRLSSALVILTLLISSAGANAAQMVSGQTQNIGNVLTNGNSSYTIYYQYPASVLVGTNATVELTLHVNQFTGQIEYIYGYGLEAQLFIGGHELDNTIYGPAGFNTSSFLYPGEYWGPKNFTFSFTEANTGLAVGQSENASLQITLRDTVFYGVPVNGYQTEPAMQAEGGTFLIQNTGATTSSTNTSTTSASTPPSSSPSILPYALLASGVVLMVAAVLVTRGPRPAQSAQR